MSERIGIFKEEDGALGFYAEDLPSTVGHVLKATSDLLGEDVEFVDEPPAGTRAKHVGDVVIEPVTDPITYLVKASEAPVGKPEVNRTPDADPGTWVTQSVVFNKETFASVDDCKAWIKERDDVGDYGYDETDNSFRYRQFDPEHFSEFKTLAATDGVSFVRGKVKQEEAEEDEEKATKAADLARDAVEAMWTLNRGILAKGVRLLTKSATIRKDDDGGEERFALGLVLEPNDGEGGAPLKPDTQDDVYSADDIRKTAHGWMENYGQIDLMHSWKALGKEDVRILETYLAPVDFTIGEGDDEYTVLKGTWLLGVRVANDVLWEAIKNNEIGAYSIGGTAERVPLEGEPEA